MQASLTREQKLQLFRDGFVVLPQVLSPQQLQRARALVESVLPRDERRLLVPGALATSPVMTGLLMDSPLHVVLAQAMGPFPPVISCQVAVTPPHDRLGGSPGTHVDGGWSGRIPSTADEIDLQAGRPRDAATYFGEHDEIRGANDGLLWMDPGRRLSYGSYTALVGVALNDQLEPGNGQFAVLKGTHDTVAAAFRAQRDAGGIVGPEGPGWPRIRVGDDGRPCCNGLPDAVRAIADSRRREGTATEQWPWPELTPVLLAAGDAVIALHGCPHTATPNLGPNPRMNIYFRIRRLREGNPHEGSRRVAHGVSDHPDRGYFGQFLAYPDGYDPWQTSIDKLCDPWSEWAGMRDIVSAR